jgi:predicted dehydrogenase
MSEKDETNYELKADAKNLVAAPELDYRAPEPNKKDYRIALIGCGGIAKTHLEAYRSRSWKVVALCDIKKEAAKALREEFYPDAAIFESYAEMLESDEIDVVDIALHPKFRIEAIEAALEAGKHVLSQKPFVLDLKEGARLARLADEKGLKLAVNQNGRWAPYVSYALRAIEKGLLGDVQSVSIALNWDHSWCKGTPFEEIHHLILYDFAIHWFDMTQQFFQGNTACDVFARVSRAPGQDMKPPLIAAATLQYESGMASLLFDGHRKGESREALSICGSRGSYQASGSVCGGETVRLLTAEGESFPSLEGTWFVDGFAGAMGELLCSIEEDRQPSNSAWNNLESLSVCFAAIRSADTGKPVKPGDGNSIEN